MPLSNTTEQCYTGKVLINQFPDSFLVNTVEMDREVSSQGLAWEKVKHCRSRNYECANFSERLWH